MSMGVPHVGAEKQETQRIGVISDTHGRLPATAMAILEGVGLIIHAGDIDTPDVLERLRRIAPTLAVRGNMDRGAWAAHLPSADMIDIGKIRIYVRHIIGDIDLDPVAARVDLVISGHTHRCEQTRKNGVLYLNPGSACLPRAGSPASMAVVTVAGIRAEVQFVPLEGSG
jgi:putative phosphoesterase